MTGLQAPEEEKEISVPPYEGLGPDNRQELRPFDESGQEDECNTRGVVWAAWSDLAFDVTRKLLPEEQILSCQLRSRPKHESQEA